MHILFDYQIFALQSCGGISRYFNELAARLPDYSDSLRTTILAPLHINDYLFSSHSPDRMVKGVKIAGFPGKHRILPFCNRAISKVYLKTLQPDICHETYYTCHPVQHSKPTVLTVYDMIHERFPDLFTGVDRKIPEQKAAAIERADQIIAISNATSSDLQRYLNVPENKISVISLASSLNTFNGTPDSPVHDSPFLLYVGLREGVKNFSCLLRAYGESRKLRENVDLLCVGGGSFTPDERAELQEKSLEDRVHQLSANDTVLKWLYNHATVFVYPSLYEGFGLPLVEAMQCGCPIACSNTSSMPEVAGDAAMYFSPNDCNEMREVLEDLVQSESDRALLRKKGYQRAESFTWDACIAKTAEVYSRLA